jgi:hypothetical protein
MWLRPVWLRFHGWPPPGLSAATDEDVGRGPDGHLDRRARPRVPRTRALDQGRGRARTHSVFRARGPGTLVTLRRSRPAALPASVYVDVGALPAERRGADCSSKQARRQAASGSELARPSPACDCALRRARGGCGVGRLVERLGDGRCAGGVSLGARLGP